LERTVCILDIVVSFKGREEAIEVVVGCVNVLKRVSGYQSSVDG
jgi:hypothetical protein